MAKRQWYRLGPGCEWDGLTAASTIANVRVIQTKVLKTAFILPDGTRFDGAPPIVPEEWFNYDGGDDIRDLFLENGIIVPYEPAEHELAFAYEHMFPKLKPVITPTPKRNIRKQDDVDSVESVSDLSIDNSEVEDE